ncbi:restriction endonuclease subunit S [uncultured Fluviicola sp.]|uniref:restriction endonuclease subunit S n=1 Tax=uncultured Fluviicola sp. TaxID=463303 RepID=UPI0025D7DA6B|nr:restriction endonuclease subunit S [uncultured Fluviicola sp.]
MVKETTMKQTEIGLLPEDWEVMSLGDILLSNPDYGINASAVKYNDALPTYLRITDIDDEGNFIKKNLSSVNNINSEKYYLNKDEIVFARTGASVGKTYLYKEYDGRLVFAGFLIRLKINTEEASSKFVFYNTQTTYYKNWIISNSMRSGQPGINSNEIKGFQIPLPPLPEQEFIAEALSDTDTWIESLEKLVNKKRLIKQGAMQKLLTPKDDWEEKTIFEIAEKKRDLFNDGDWVEAIHIKEEGIRLIQTGNIGVGKFLNKSNKKYISEKSFVDLKCKEILEGDLLICRLAEPAGRVCIFPKTEDRKSVTSVDVTIYRPDVNVFDRRVLLYLLSTDEWFKQVLEQVGGTTHKRISRGNLGNIKIMIPKSLEEQTRIATILSDMDIELETLDNQLAKARQIKQGMMQELLTGRTRFI